MSLPLDGCWAKIERANENIKNLETEIAALVIFPSFRTTSPEIV